MKTDKVDPLALNMDEALRTCQAIFEVVLHPIIIFNQDKCIINISKTALKGLPNYNIDKVIGSSLYTFLQDNSFPYRRICCQINNVFDYVLKINVSHTFKDVIMNIPVRITITGISGKYIIVQVNEQHKYPTKSQNIHRAFLT